jgi:hypothetical protein
MRNEGEIELWQMRHCRFQVRITADGDYFAKGVFTLYAFKSNLVDEFE